MLNRFDNPQQMYPAELNDNPWTFVTGPFTRQLEPVLPQLPEAVMLDLDAPPPPPPPPLPYKEQWLPKVYVIDSPRWNYEARVYMDLNEGIWLQFMLSDRWADMHTLLLNKHKNRIPDGMLPNLEGTWGLRSPVFGNGNQLDAVMNRHRVADYKWRKVKDLEGKPVELSFLKLREGKLE